MSADLYAVLMLDRHASARRIRSAYLELARRFHPDLNPDDEAARHQFNQIVLAYEILGDPIKRRLYDHDPSSVNQETVDEHLGGLTWSEIEFDKFFAEANRLPVDSPVIAGLHVRGKRRWYARPVWFLTFAVCVFLVTNVFFLFWKNSPSRRSQASVIDSSADSAAAVVAVDQDSSRISNPNTPTSSREMVSRAEVMIVETKVKSAASVNVKRLPSQDSSNATHQAVLADNTQSKPFEFWVDPHDMVLIPSQEEHKWSDPIYLPPEISADENIANSSNTISKLPDFETKVESSSVLPPMPPKVLEYFVRQPVEIYDPLQVATPDTVHGDSADSYSSRFSQYTTSKMRPPVFDRRESVWSAPSSRADTRAEVLGRIQSRQRMIQDRNLNPYRGGRWPGTVYQQYGYHQREYGARHTPTTGMRSDPRGGGGTIGFTHPMNSLLSPNTTQRSVSTGGLWTPPLVEPVFESF